MDMWSQNYLQPTKTKRELHLRISRPHKLKLRRNDSQDHQATAHIPRQVVGRGFFGPQKWRWWGVFRDASTPVTVGQGPLVPWGSSR